MTTSRPRHVVANWKMNKTPAEAAAFAAEFLAVLSGLPPAVGVAITPAFPAIDRLGKALAGSRVALGAQDVYTEAKGAFTGEVSAAMLRDLGASFALVGHSERRRYRHEEEGELARKIRRLLDMGLAPLYCVGETLDERESGDTDRVLTRQMTCLDSFPDPPPGLIVAYEPVWAIGTGRAATPQIAARAHGTIRRLLASRYGEAMASAIRVLYGGSVTPTNAGELFREEEIDGGLVGGASLVAGDFAAIVSAAG